MPFNVFEIIEEKLEQARIQLETRRFDDPESVSDEEIKNLTKLFTAFRAAKKATDSLAESDEPITGNQANEALSTYVEYMEQVKAYSELPEDSVPNEMQQVMGTLQNMMVVVEGHAKGLEDVAKANAGAEPVTMKDIQSDFSWVANVFSKDPNVADKNEVVDRKWVGAEHTMQENLEKYRDCIKTVTSSFNRHMSAITGSDKPMEAFNDKIDLIQMALNKAWHPGKPIQVQPVKYVMADIANLMSYQNVTKLDRAEIINDLWFDVVAGKEDGPDIFCNHIDNSPIKGSNADAFKTAFKKIYITPHDFGIDNSTRQALNESSRDAMIIGNIIYSLVYENSEVDPTLNDDFDHPMYNAIKIAKEMNKEIISFIQGKPGAKLPTEDDAMQLLEAMADGSMKSELFLTNRRPPVFNGYKDIIKDYSADLLKIYPGMKERFQPVIDECHAHNKAEVDEAIKEYIEADMWEDGFVGYSEMTEQAISTSFYDADTVEKLQFLTICKDTNKSDMFIKRAPSQKTLLLAYLCRYETRCFFDCNAEGGYLTSKIEHPYNRDIANIYNGETLTPDRLEKVYEYYDGLMSCPNVREMLDMPLNELSELLKNADMGVLIYGPGSQVPKSLSGDTLDALCRATRLGFENSPQYNDIKDAIRLVAAQSHTFGGINDDTYRTLYNACTTYMYTHDSNPTTPIGKTRFNAAATVMADIYSKVYEKFPDMRKQMERDLEANMIRSRHFREKVAEFNPDLAEAAEDVGNVLHDMLGKTMITGKAETPEVQDALLGKFRALTQRHGEEMEKKEFANDAKKFEKGGVIHLS